MVLIYRPGSEAITTTFFVDLAETLDRVVAYNDSVYIVGDLNVRLDRDDDINTKQLLELLDVYGFTVQVNHPTHARGGLLDVFATHRDDAPLPVSVYDAELSDPLATVVSTYFKTSSTCYVCRSSTVASAQHW